MLFLDLKLPRRSGFEVLEWLTLQPHLTNMLKVILSGHGDPEAVARALRLGAHTFLNKPIHPDDIIRLRKAFYQYWT